MDRIVQSVEKAALTLPGSEVSAVLGNTGIIYGEYGVTRSTNVGEVMVDLVERSERERTIEEIIEDLRSRVGVISGIRSVEFHQLEGGPPVGEPVAVQIKGKDLDEVEPLVSEIKGILKGIPGVKEFCPDHLRPGACPGIQAGL